MTDQELRKECMDKAIYAYGTAFLFEQRTNSLRRKLRLITFLSLAVPVCMGGIAMAFSSVKFLPIAVIIGGVLSIPLFILTLWSNIFRWEERYAASLQAMKNNNKLKNKFEAIAKYKGDDFATKVSALIEQDQGQEDSDLEQDITTKDKRMMMRASLIQYKRTCAICGIKPLSMKPSACDTCGNF